MAAAPTFYLETHSQDPAFNLAFEEFVLTHRTREAYLLLWQNDNTIVIGQNQNVEEEIDRAFVDANHIHVVRRMSGGGAVYHDLGNLNYSFITDAGDKSQLAFSRFTAPVVSALKALGLDAEASGRNDILVSGQKVSGTAQRLAGDRILHHGTLLFDSDLNTMSRALRADPEKFRSKSTKSVRSRVGNIRSLLKNDMTLEEFWSYLRDTLVKTDFTPTVLAEHELAAIRQLKINKYDTWEWNFGRSPTYESCNRRRFAGGTLEILLTIREGHITQIAFCGDFLSLCSLDTLRQALTGCPFRQESVNAVLRTFPLNQYFGSISKEEILQTMFYSS